MSGQMYRWRHCWKLFRRYYSKEGHQFPKQIFSAIQPTGEVHLGNYFGAIQKWVKLQNTEENVIFCIADLHSLTLPKDPQILNESILGVTATLLASGINPDKCVFFQQSQVHQHSELSWLLGTLSNMAKLSHLPQFKEKSTEMTEIPLGLFLYPILQVADITLYKATDVPVGADQIKHIEFANRLIRFFNNKYGITFPEVKSELDVTAGNIKSLRDPGKKMSKSHHPKTRINLTDSPEDIKVKCRKALTDSLGTVTYDPEGRPGVSNLVLIHSLLTNKTTDEVCEEVKNLNVAQYKPLLADIIIESLKHIREEIKRLMNSREYLVSTLLNGSEKARERAEITTTEVKSKMGIHLETAVKQQMRREIS